MSTTTPVSLETTITITRSEVTEATIAVPVAELLERLTVDAARELLARIERGEATDQDFYDVVTDIDSPVFEWLGRSVECVDATTTVELG